MPFNALELKEKVENKDWMDEVDEGIANVTLSLQV